MNVRRMTGPTASRGRLVAVALAIAAQGVCPALASAQRFTITPTLGVYVSGGTLYSQGSIDNPSTFLQKRPEGSPILGVSGVFWMTSHLGIRAAVNFGPAPTAVSDSNGTYDDPSGAWFGNAELIATLHPFRSVNSVFIGLGGGMISWKGSEWQYASGTTLPALVGTVGVVFPIRALWAPKPYRPAKSAWTFEVTDYVTHSQFDKGLATQTPEVTRGDVTINIGLAVSVGNW